MMALDAAPVAGLEPWKQAPQLPWVLAPTETVAAEVEVHTPLAVDIAVDAVVEVEAQLTPGFQHPGRRPFRKSAGKEASPDHPSP